LQIGFYFDQTRCTGCFTCVVACKDWHDVPAGPTSWIRILTLEKGKYPNLFVSFLRISCYHCLEPACVSACSANAITKRKQDGVVIVDKEKCLGQKCGLCLESCPYNAPQFRDEADAKMEKCDFCIERLAGSKKPICVDACPMRALDAGPMEELQIKYGNIREAEGFVYSNCCIPSIIFKPKKDTKNLDVKKQVYSPQNR